MCSKRFFPGATQNKAHQIKLKDLRLNIGMDFESMVSRIEICKIPKNALYFSAQVKVYKYPPVKTGVYLKLNPFGITLN